MITFLIKRMFGQALSCRGVNDFIVAYIDGDLEPSVLKKFEAHLEMCPNCGNYLKGYQEMLGLLKEEDEIPVPHQDLVDHTMSFLEREFFDES